MSSKDQAKQFEATLQRPASPADASWLFVVLPGPVSETLPRRGRTTVEGQINGHPYQATLEPDGKQSHWLLIDEGLQNGADVAAGDTVTITVSPVETEPEPEVPDDLKEALAANPEAQSVWNDTTTIARLDWIHWVVSARQQKTREKRIQDACEMLSSGKKRVRCFDPSGFYSKALKAPEPAN